MHLKAFALTTSAAFVLCGVSPAHATDQPLSFGGLSITETCSIILPIAGTLAISADGKTISSDSATSASATVVTTAGGFDLSVAPPDDFDAPSPDGAGTGTTFTASLATDGSGDTGVFDVLNGVTQTLGFGSTPVTVDIAATRDTVYESGIYAATATLQCVASG